MEFFQNKIFTLNDTERKILGDIVQEGMQAFLPPYDNPVIHKLLRRNDSSFGSEQMLKVHLQSLLINLIRRNQQLEKAERLSSAVRERAEEDVILR